ncbi:MAG: PAS domain-containing protein [Polyangiales bacterium]
MWLQVVQPRARPQRQARARREDRRGHHRRQAPRRRRRRSARGHRQVAGGHRVRPRWHHSNGQRELFRTLGYSLNEIKGKHHSMFVEESYRSSNDYREFWARLNRGEYVAEEFKRIGRGGKEVWIQASYNPIFDLNGKPFKVVKYAMDVTAEKIKAADYAGQLAAIGKSQAVIEFDLDGTIRTANENFLRTLGYSLNEIKGKHHSMFVEESYRGSNDYREFWARLNRGEYVAEEFKRIGRGGKEVWIQASYNPIFDLNGRPFKVEVRHRRDRRGRDANEDGRGARRRGAQREGALGLVG